jgi:uncharacterized protein (DUF305 family)
MINKGLMGGLIGFMLGGVVVSLASTYLPTENPASTIEHNQQMTKKLGLLSGDAFDQAYMIEMIRHHQGAIDMAKLAETQAQHHEIKQLSADILKAQSTEIDMMQAWQNDWGYKSVPTSHEAH